MKLKIYNICALSIALAITGIVSQAQSQQNIPLMGGAQTPSLNLPILTNPQQAAQNANTENEKRKVILPEIEDVTGKLNAGFWETYWIEAVITIIAVILILWLLLRPKKKIPPTPYETAKMLLSVAPKIFDEFGGKKYAEAVSQLVRDYLEARHNLPAPERTTEEFLEITADSKLFDKDQRDRLSAILKLSDLAKFAALGFGKKERDELLKNADEFVECDNILTEKSSKKNSGENKPASIETPEVKGDDSPSPSLPEPPIDNSKK